MLSVLWPVMLMATLRGTASRSKRITAARRRSCGIASAPGYDWTDLDANGEVSDDLRSAVEMFERAHEMLGSQLVSYATRPFLTPDLLKIVERANRDVGRHPDAWERFWKRRKVKRGK